MRKTIRKVYKGTIELRDYDVEECIKKDENMYVVHDFDKMILTPEDLVNKRVSVSAPFASKLGGKTYKLYAYNWEPDQSSL
jgi:hypothetical protein